MKNSLTFLLLLLVTIFFINITFKNFISEQQNIYETDLTYINNNPKAFDDINLLENNLVTKHNIIATDGTKIFFTDFSSIELASGRYPKNDEYISNKQNDDPKNVGVFKNNLANNYKRIYKYSYDKLNIISINFVNIPNDVDKDYLKTNGFVLVDDDNMEKVIGIEMYNLIKVITNIFLVVMIVIVILFLITTTQEYFFSYLSKFEIYKSLGGNSIEAGLLFLRFHIMTFIKSFIVASVYLLLLLTGSFILLNNISIVTCLLGLLYLVIVFIVLILYYYISACLYYRKNILMHSLDFNSNISLFVIIMCLVTLILAFFNIKLSLLIIVTLLLSSFAFMESLIIKIIFNFKLYYKFIIILIVSLLLFISTVVINIPIDELVKRDNIVATTVIENSMFSISEDTHPDLIVAMNDDRFHYINPIDGVKYDDETFFPLVKATKLELFQKYNISGTAINDKSVLIGEVFSKDAHIKVGDEISINNQSVKVTNIVDSNEYAGQMIYMSDDRFMSLYGNNGVEYYISQYNDKQLQEMGYVINNYFDANSLLTLWNNSLVSIMLVPTIMLGFLIVISVIIIYQIFKVLILNSRRKINIIRSLGINKREFCKELFLFLSTFSIKSIIVAILMYSLFIDVVQELILELSGSYIDFHLYALIVIGWILLLVILQGLVIALTYYQLNKNSIYEESKLTQLGEL